MKELPVIYIPLLYFIGCFVGVFVMAFARFKEKTSFDVEDFVYSFLFSWIGILIVLFVYSNEIFNDIKYKTIIDFGAEKWNKTKK